MLQFQLARYETSLHGTKGILTGAGYKCRTLELPWFNNSAGISCIPVGTYLCKYELSPRFKKRMYGVINVPNRAGIRIHSANYGGSSAHGLKCQLLGCISLGTGFCKDVCGQDMLMCSKNSIREFEKITGGEDFMLTILWAAGGENAT